MRRKRRRDGGGEREAAWGSSQPCFSLAFPYKDCAALEVVFEGMVSAETLCFQSSCKLRHRLSNLPVS